MLTLRLRPAALQSRLLRLSPGEWRGLYAAGICA